MCGYPRREVKKTYLKIIQELTCKEPTPNVHFESFIYSMGLPYWRLFFSSMFWCSYGWLLGWHCKSLVRMIVIWNVHITPSPPPTVFLHTNITIRNDFVYKSASVRTIWFTPESLSIGYLYSPDTEQQPSTTAHILPVKLSLALKHFSLIKTVDWATNLMMEQDSYPV